MVSQRNALTVKDVSEQLKKYPVIGILDMFKLPAGQLHHIRGMLKGKAVIRMVKKRLMVLALKESGLRGIDALGDRIQGEPALIMTEMNPFGLARLIGESKSEAPAKGGDIAPRDITVRAGPTPLLPGPVIGELQKAKIPAMIEGDKIHIREDTVVAREGQEIDSLLAGVLSKLGIMPMEIGLNLIAVWERGNIYGRDILFIPQESYLNDLTAAHARAFSLALNLTYPTAETLPLLLSRAHQEARNLALETGTLTSETARPLLAMAHAQAEALKAESGLKDDARASEPEGKKLTGQPEKEVEETGDEKEPQKKPEKEKSPPGEGKEKPGK
jgi:large subunit ribosomal protein L10